MVNHTPNKTCAHCQKEKPHNAFSVDRRKADGLDSYCRDCKAEKRKKVPLEKAREYQRHYREKFPDLLQAKRQKDNEKYGAEKARRYRERHPIRTKASRDRQRQEKRDWIAAYKSERGCLHCGIKDHRVLDLHHINGADKEAAVSQLANRSSWQALKAEAEKCQVLCANCHRILHYQDALKNPAAAT